MNVHGMGTHRQVKEAAPFSSVSYAPGTRCRVSNVCLEALFVQLLLYPAGIRTSATVVAFLLNVRSVFLNGDC